MADLTSDQLRALHHSAEMLAMCTQGLLAYPDSSNAESWRNRVALYARRISEISEICAPPRDLAIKP